MRYDVIIFTDYNGEQKLDRVPRDHEVFRVGRKGSSKKSLRDGKGRK